MTPLSIALKQNMERKSREMKTPAFFVFIFVLFNRKFNILEKNNHIAPIDIFFRCARLTDFFNI